jgi:hypothetical protein
VSYTYAQGEKIRATRKALLPGDAEGPTPKAARPDADKFDEWAAEERCMDIGDK